jgi:LuxR family maltose regulon positive regulatory protein
MPPRHLVDRPRVRARLDAATRGVLTLVAAPAGWGKTTAVAAWAAVVDRPVTWIDGGAPDAEESIAKAADTAGHAVVDAAERLGPEARAVLARLVETPGALTHWTVVTRTGSLLAESVARLRLHDEVSTVRPVDLAFDRDETRALLDLVATDSAADIVETLLARTDGWPAAVALAAFAQRGVDDPRAVVDHIGGNDPHVRAFVRAEILAPLDEPTARFVLLAAALDDLDPGAVAHVTGRRDAAQLLETLETNGVVERDDPTHTLRFPVIVRDALRAELRVADVAMKADALRLAAAWHARRRTPDDLERAGRYLERAEDWVALAEHARAYARPMHEAGRMRSVVGWLDALPSGTVRDDLDTLLVHVVATTLVGDTFRAERLLRDAGDVSARSDGTRATIAATRAVWVHGHLPPLLALEAADEAVVLIDRTAGEPFESIGDITTATSTRTIVRIAEAFAYWSLGRVDEAMARLRVEEQRGNTLPLTRLNLATMLAHLEAGHGSPEAAERYAVQARRIARVSLSADHPFLFIGDMALAHVLIERNELDRAEDVLDRANQLLQGAPFDAWLGIEAIERAWLAFARGAPRRALTTLDVAFRRGDPPPMLAARTRALAARSLLALGDPIGAAHRLAFSEHEPTRDTAAVATQLALAAGDVVRARRLVDSWPAGELLQDRWTRALWAAAVEFAQGATTSAAASVEDLVAAAATERAVRLLIDGGPDVRRIVGAVARRRPGGFAAALLHGESGSDRPADVVPAAALSGRELDVLRHLADRLTYGEIADLLFISPNTVKSHAKSIYSKLDVKGRHDAVARADQLGLL